MKRLVLLAALPILFVSCSPKDPSDPKFVVAKGDGIKITRADLDKQTDEKLKQMGMPPGQFPKAQLKMIEPQILDQLINTDLILAAAEKAGIKDVDKKVDEEYAKISKGKDPAEFQKKLTEAGYTEQSIKAMMRKQILIQEFLESKIPKEVAVTDDQAMAFYKEHEDKFKEPEMITAQHILVMVPKEATPAEKAAKEKIIKDARARIVKGEAFEAVAAAVSEDPSSKAQGGMLEPFGKGQMVPQFEKVAFESKPDVLSPVFTTDYGFHIMKVKKHSPPHVVTFDEIKDRIKTKLGEDEKAKAAQAYVEKLRKDADVKVLLPDPKADMPAAGAPGAPGSAGGPGDQGAPGADTRVRTVEPAAPQAPEPAPAPAPAKP